MSENRDLSRASWLKSSFSNGQGGECVEHARLPDGSRAVRHSMDPEGPVLILTRVSGMPSSRASATANSTDPARHTSPGSAGMS